MASKQSIAAARSRNGKPSDANRIEGQTQAQRVYEGQAKVAKANDGSTVARGPNGEIYRYVPKYDYTTIERDGNISAPRRGNQIPGSLSHYMDKVLDMGGMRDAQQGTASGTGVPGANTNIPTPQERPDTVTPDIADVPIPTARPKPDEGTGDNNGSWLPWLIGGGAATAAILGALRLFAKNQGTTLEALPENVIKTVAEKLGAKGPDAAPEGTPTVAADEAPKTLNDAVTPGEDVPAPDDNVRTTINEQAGDIQGPPNVANANNPGADVGNDQLNFKYHQTARNAAEIMDPATRLDYLRKNGFEGESLNRIIQDISDLHGPKHLFDFNIKRPKLK